ncbi:MAG: ABC transporter ATP-binding protein [Deltaproteobacteria bacterium]|nr:ABC transporter ATP-binding protein [Deltaproteobacteria bacterium]
MTHPIIQVSNLNKVYQGGFKALQEINLEVKRGEIFALLGPNGAGKTTLISIICGIVNATSGKVLVDGADIRSDYRITRSLIGLVPQELTTDAFETVWHTVSFSRGLFGLAPNPAYIEDILKKLSLWEKRDQRIRTLSGGMKRRLMIAKALSHEPKILFLDEPTAGVDVELRKDMWEQIDLLRNAGVTIILTTHYIEEAEEMADRIGVINHGKMVLIEEKEMLMKQLGSKQLILDLYHPLQDLPAGLEAYQLGVSSDKMQLIYSYDSHKTENKIPELLSHLQKASISLKDLNTQESSLEDIFVKLVKKS